MIVFDLICSDGHRFESWFRNGAAYEEQSRRNAIACPVCGDVGVAKAPMRPYVARRGGLAADAPDREGPAPAASPASSSPAASSVPSAPVPSEVVPSATATAGAGSPPASSPPAPAAEETLRALRRLIEGTCDDVGPAFPEEARRIHYGETDARGIYGEASADEAKALREEGIAIQAVPWMRRRHD